MIVGFVLPVAILDHFLFEKLAISVFRLFTNLGAEGLKVATKHAVSLRTEKQRFAGQDRLLREIEFRWCTIRHEMILWTAVAGAFKAA